jgi:Zn-dependent protease with chaperone function
MMFAARCLGVSLAVFVLAYVLASMVVGAGWRIVLRMFRPSSPRSKADLLFLLRILPLITGLVVSFGLALPSFLLLEPRSTDEAVGTAPFTLALVFVAFAIWGLWSVARAQRRTSRAIEQWLQDSTRLDAGEGVPVFRSHRPSPTLTVAGVCAPKVIVSDEAAMALTAAELRTALRHEMAHVRRYDNLKKLIFRLAVSPCTSALEAAWMEETELAADDAAVTDIDDALDLASALIKVSRLGFVSAKTEFTTALLHSSTALTMRIHRLFAWSGQKRPAPVRAYAAGVMFLGAFALGLVTSYSSLLSGMHQLTEWLVR